MIAPELRKWVVEAKKIDLPKLVCLCQPVDRFCTSHLRIAEALKKAADHARQWTF